MVLGAYLLLMLNAIQIEEHLDQGFVVYNFQVDNTYKSMIFGQSLAHLFCIAHRPDDFDRELNLIFEGVSGSGKTLVSSAMLRRYNDLEVIEKGKRYQFLGESLAFGVVARYDHYPSSNDKTVLMDDVLADRRETLSSYRLNILEHGEGVGKIHGRIALEGVISDCFLPFLARPLPLHRSIQLALPKALTKTKGHEIFMARREKFDIS